MPSAPFAARTTGFANGVVAPEQWENATLSVDDDSPPPAAALMQRSGIVDGPVTIKDSQTVFLPFGWLGPGRPGRRRTVVHAVAVVREPPRFSCTPTRAAWSTARALRRPHALLPRRLLAFDLKRGVIASGTCTPMTAANC